MLYNMVKCQKISRTVGNVCDKITRITYDTYLFPDRTFFNNKNIQAHQYLNIFQL